MQWAVATWQMSWEFKFRRQHPIKDLLNKHVLAIPASKAICSVGLAVTLAGVLLYFSLRGIEWRPSFWTQDFPAARLSLSGESFAVISSVTIFLRSLPLADPSARRREHRGECAFWHNRGAATSGTIFYRRAAGELVRTFNDQFRDPL